MKVCCLLSVLVLALTGCASAPETETGARKERVADAYIPVGTAIPRKRTEQSPSKTSEVDKQSLENERTMGSAAINPAR